VVTGLDSRTPPAEGEGVALAAPTRPDLRSHRVELGAGAATTVHVAVYPRAHVTPAVVLLAAPEPLAAWCARSGVTHALVGGFFVTPGGPALGEVRVGGVRAETRPFDPRFASARACLHVGAGTATIAPLAALAPLPAGDLLQAGPALVAGGRPLVAEGDDPEGFSAGGAQFDSDITAGRHPRAAVGFDGSRFLAVATEGRSPDEAGLTLAELATVRAGLGAEAALNLDGGGSTSLVVDGRLVNRPREADGTEVTGGRAIATALAFVPRAQEEAAAA
jgi:hypothetical protein